LLVIYYLEFEIKPKQRRNSEITAPEIRLIDENNSQVGIIPTSEALAMAETKGLDLIEVAPEADPPVCKLLDFDKLRYKKKLKREKSRKNIKKQELKEIRLSPNTSDNDVNIKSNQAVKFLEKGDKVKVSIQFRGRQITHPELGREIMKQLQDNLTNFGTIEQGPSFENRKLTAIFKPLSEE